MSRIPRYESHLPRWGHSILQPPHTETGLPEVEDHAPDLAEVIPYSEILDERARIEEAASKIEDPEAAITFRVAEVERLMGLATHIPLPRAKSEQ